METEIGPEDVLAQETHFLGLGDGGASPVYGSIMSMPNEDIGMAGVCGEPRQDYPFDQRLRVAFENRLVVEGSRVSFFAVTEYVFLRCTRPGKEAPLHSSRESRAAPAT